MKDCKIYMGRDGNFGVVRVGKGMKIGGEGMKKGEMDARGVIGSREVLAWSGIRAGGMVRMASREVYMGPRGGERSVAVRVEAPSEKPLREVKFRPRKPLPPPPKGKEESKAEELEKKFIAEEKRRESTPTEEEVRTGMKEAASAEVSAEVSAVLPELPCSETVEVPKEELEKYTGFAKGEWGMGGGLGEGSEGGKRKRRRKRRR